MTGPLPKHEGCSDIGRFQRELAATRRQPTEDPDPVRDLYEGDRGLDEDA